MILYQLKISLLNGEVYKKVQGTKNTPILGPYLYLAIMQPAAYQTGRVWLIF